MLEVELGLGRVVPHDEAVGDEPLLDRRDGAEDARVVGRQEAGRGDQQQAGVELLRAIGDDEAVELGVEALGADIGMDHLAQRPPRPRPGRRGRIPAIMRTPRSKATQAITFE